MRNYIPRLADKILSKRLESRGAVLIVGPKWCGKSTTAMQQAKSAVFMQDPATREQNMMLAQIDPSRFLEGKTPKLIDEWQIIPTVWDAIRFEIDKRSEFGQFILTGSVTPPNTEQITHSGTGRIARMHMSTMTLYESGDSTAEVSIEQLFDDADAKVAGSTAKSVEDIAFFICRGGWPQAIGQKRHIALQQPIDYVDSIYEAEFNKINGSANDPQRMQRIVRSFARNISTQANLQTIKKDIAANDLNSISDETIASYLKVLNKLYVVQDLPAWSPNIRSRTAIRTSQTRHFTDPSIATAALGLGPDDLMNDLKTLGLFFESLVVHDLRAYAQLLDGDLYHYRDKTGLEADAIIHLRDGRYALIEAKLASQDSIEEGAKNLLKLRNKIDTSKMLAPSFLMVVTATPYAYKREDEVIVAPLACLAP